MSKILPMMIVPYMVQSGIIPMMLISLKHMLLKSMLLGKLAIVLWAINTLWRTDSSGSFTSHNINIDDRNNKLIENHYGYTGGEEYGAYINKRRKK